MEVEREVGRHAASVAALARGWSRTSVVGGGSGAERLRVASLAVMSVRRRGSVMRSDSTILREGGCGEAEPGEGIFGVGGRQVDNIKDGVAICDESFGASKGYVI